MEQRVSEIAPDAAPAAAERPVARALGVLRGLGPARLAALGAVALGLLGFFAYLMLRVGGTEYALLYTGLDLEDSAGIVSRLEAMGVPYELRGDGGTILVPQARARRLRMALAEAGLPRGGAVGYEIFDSTSALGTTSFLADINLKRALEGELSRTIAALDGVRAARVHLVLPKRELFRRDRVEPSASVALRLAGGAPLGRRQVLAVQHLVAAAVPGLRPEQVAVIDDRGTLLARGGDGDEADALLPAQAEEFKAAYEARLKRTVEELLARSLGPGRVRAEVSAEIDFDRVQVTSESFDPDSQVARSTQFIDEERHAAERDTDETVGVATNLPAAGGALGGGSTSSEQSSRSEEIINYEISRTVRNQTRVGGQVQRLSVAVLVDGTYAPNAAGEPVYRPRGEAEIDQIAALVRSAIGFDAQRGDIVEVINMPFAAPEPVELAEAGWGGLDAADLRRLVEILALVLLGALLILFVLRPALTRLLPPPGQPALAGAGAAAVAALPALPGAGESGAGADGGSEDGTPDQEERLIDVKRIEGQVRASLLHQVIDFIEESPDEAVSIVRGWLYER